MRRATTELVAGTAHPALGAAIAHEMGVDPTPQKLERTPDGEVLVRVDERVRGRDVTIVQSTGAPVGEHLLELLLLADGCRRAGARRVVAAIPYLGYARQDRREHVGEPLGARVFADVVACGRFERLLVVDPHNAAVEAGFACPVELLTAVPLLARAVQANGGEGTVVVAPDLGATKLAQRYAQALSRPMAIVHKQRLGPREVVAGQVIGEVRGLTPVVVDDIVSTAATMAAAIERVLADGARPPVTIVATHGLFSGPAMQRLGALPIARVITTDSVPQPPRDRVPFVHDVVTLAPLLTEAIRRVHERE
jgi:ribose-phosphate pyrophosphokinase